MLNQTILDSLRDFISIQSVSSDPTRAKQMKQAVSFLTQKLESLDFKVTSLQKKDAPPLIIARKDIGASKTIGIYGHYDVQHEDPVAEWESEPFMLTARNGKYFGRGTADTKGHIIQNIAAIEQLIVENKLSTNIVFILEGEEETGSEHFEIQIREKSEELKDIDVFYILDSGMFKKNVPQIEYALRGLVYFEIELSTGNRDLHSGLYGNAAVNPALVLSSLLAKMKDIDTGRILIPHFYDDMTVPSPEELELLKEVQLSDSELTEEMNAYLITTTNGLPSYLAPKIAPSMDVHGIVSGFIVEGPKTVIPHTATAKFSFRLVENQNPDTIEGLVMEFIEKNIPSKVKYGLKVYAKDSPFYTSLDNEYIKKTADIFSEHFGNKTVFNRSGGSIPAAEIIQRLFGKPVIITGFTLPDENIHAPNENIDEEMFWKGIEALKKVYSI